MLQDIWLHCVKICHRERFNKKLNGKWLGKSYRRDFWTESSGKKGGVTSLTQRKQDMQEEG